MSINRADWVTCIAAPGPVGFVKRVAADGSWADVDWHGHTKRMATIALRAEHTIPFGDGTVTDETRRRELQPEVSAWHHAAPRITDDPSGEASDLGAYQTPCDHCGYDGLGRGFALYEMDEGRYYWLCEECC